MAETSFLDQTSSLQDAAKLQLIPKLSGSLVQNLTNIDRFIQDLEDLISNGMIVAVKGEKHNISPADVAQACGEKAYGEIAKVSKEGRAFLESVGFKKVVRVKPQAMIGNRGQETHLVSPYTEHPRGGDPLEGATITPLQPQPQISTTSKAKD